MSSVCNDGGKKRLVDVSVGVDVGRAHSSCRTAPFFELLEERRPATIQHGSALSASTRRRIHFRRNAGGAQGAGVRRGRAPQLNRFGPRLASQRCASAGLGSPSRQASESRARPTVDGRHKHLTGQEEVSARINLFSAVLALFSTVTCSSKFTTKKI
jgi:hypothetical protein